MLVARPSQKMDPFLLSPNLRQADLQEIQAASGLPPLTALQTGLRDSNICYSILCGAEVAAMFGVGESGAVWLLGSDRLKQYRLQFLRESHQWFNRLHDKFSVLWNFVDARNTEHIRWLRWLGCSFLNKHPYHGVEHRLFYEFAHVRPS